VRASVMFSALLALGPPASFAGNTTSPPPLPQGSWHVRVCFSDGPSTNQPCAFLDQRLILRIENPAAFDHKGPVVFEESISEDLARAIVGHVLSAVRAFKLRNPSAVPSNDGIFFSVYISSSVDSAEVHYPVLSRNVAPDFAELRRLLHEKARVAF
jgi:hypothetical protein